MTGTDEEPVRDTSRERVFLLGPNSPAISADGHRKSPLVSALVTLFDHKGSVGTGDQNRPLRMTS